MHSHRLCTNCQAQPAALKLTRIVESGGAEEHYLCPKCAAAHSPWHGGAEKGSPLGAAAPPAADTNQAAYDAQGAEDTSIEIQITKVSGFVPVETLLENLFVKLSPHPDDDSAGGGPPQQKGGGSGTSAGSNLATPVPADLECRTCGLPYSTYKASLLLGCPDCYPSFRALLLSDVRKFHGAIRHTGRTAQSPAHSGGGGMGAGQASGVAGNNDPTDLIKRMQQAARNEDYALAAELRDQLRKLKQS